VVFVSETPGLKRTDTGFLGLMADRGIAEVPAADVLVVPGGPGDELVMRREPVLAWIRTIHAHSTWTTSVCTGALILGAAGVLRGLPATTHWFVRERLREFGAEPTAERVVEAGKVITAAGVSAGIDMALVLASRIAGDEFAQGVQLGIEYDPQPPFAAGSPEKAPAAVVEMLRGGFEGLMAERRGRSAAGAGS
jgi:transcriptional regulator GlxA family with amidase domain